MANRQPPAIIHPEFGEEEEHGEQQKGNGL